MDADELLCFNAEAKIKAAWQAARRTKVADDEADINHTPAQHDVNEILQSRARAGGTSQAAVATVEDAVERELRALMRAILAGYHKKQVWSHKIWKGVDIRPVRGAGCQHGRVPRVVEEDTTGADV
ncbi:hypothetical protein SCLCIDRAFT_28280 [Scleroderma citrinum Foug A]|uniref:Sensitive to high expression protein 9, mitochondrial n=1 Tax=Scleroderma citrinum Foug A TaxID=1036808 RepID=A0A0C3DQ44_9AGAM|nr:hypothetical protein SCLCIDRAFT_28280 [Scleroderma citrinum Foug A]